MNDSGIYFGLRSIPELRPLTGTMRRAAWRQAFQSLPSGLRTAFALVDTLVVIVFMGGYIAAGHVQHPVPAKISVCTLYFMAGLAWLQVKVRRIIPILRQQIGGLCINCGYNLTGNTSGECPECGTSVDGKPRAMT